MKILIISATKLEIEPIISNFCYVNKLNSKLSCFRYNNIDVDVLISGVGVHYTIYNLMNTLFLKKYDFIINAGICGSFCNELEIGKVVNVVSEVFSDLGIEDNNKFYSLFEKELIDFNETPFKNGILVNNSDISMFNYLKLPEAKGITVNKVHGNINSIEQIISKFNPDTESMEGGAVFFVCLLEKIPFIEIRAVSNYVEVRDTKKWNIPLAVENLNKLLLEILEF
ncbi:MAG: futalosine hydrolase [Bacteroidales bacterium]|nr:futalosine hydrolase [Bacteroidales bacterium]